MVNYRLSARADSQFVTHMVSPRPRHFPLDRITCTLMLEKLLNYGISVYQVRSRAGQGSAIPLTQFVTNCPRRPAALYTMTGQMSAYGHFDE